MFGHVNRRKLIDFSINKDREQLTVAVNSINTMVNVAQGDYCSWHVVCALSKWDLYIRKNYHLLDVKYSLMILLLKFPWQFALIS